jgi:Acyl-CoA dehydrogenase, C-terminal domain
MPVFRPVHVNPAGSGLSRGGRHRRGRARGRRAGRAGQGPDTDEHRGLDRRRTGSDRHAFSAHGASSSAESEPLQRFWRDCEVASRHAVGHFEIDAQLYGQALLGVPMDVSALV